MTLRLRFPQGRLVRRHREKNRELMQASVSLITPLSVMFYVLAFWRLAADAGLASDSGLGGMMSHWQLWFAAAVALQFTGRLIEKRLAEEPLSDEVSDRVE